MKKLTASELEALIIKRNNALLSEDELGKEVFRQAMLELGLIDREFGIKGCAKCTLRLTSDIRYCTNCGAPNSGFSLNDRNCDAVTTEGVIFESVEELVEKSCFDQSQFSSAHQVAHHLSIRFRQDCGCQFKHSKKKRWMSAAQKRKDEV